ncbi:NAD-dependent epimerase/dehydratase family protein [Mycolicibacterium sediminis]|uniref:NAD-dependent epimerase/dehydratase domain-containing protein n=1 Tax=Mycolicibacterium sediminis TaxID=1286180 RepID=A0A7I7QSS3_9MYCO|nr:NAD-dependent epimerase/dehydratase family protein [Mycolicibacterium sediminis]BBY29037.1 hypothetical protein MSEDJ_31330 [Mycolicibacterium sediminis]
MTEPRRIVVTGASGNVGAGVLRALARTVPDAEVVGVCRRPPASGAPYERVRWHSVDLSSPDAATALAPAMRDADVVIHLALAIQPLYDEDYLYRANVLGSQAVLDAMATAGVPQLVYASSLGIYAAGATGPVTETWSTAGQSTSTYSRHKVMVEDLLDRFEAERPDTVVSRFRPTVVVQREAASEIQSLYIGPVIPRAALKLLRRRVLPVLPLPRGLSLQFVHSDDVGDAVARMMLRRVRGSFNVAADPLDSAALADLVGGRPVGVDPGLFRRAVVALHRLRVVAVTPGWYDVATKSPLMDTTKARRELGWTPTRSSTEAARELIDGLAEGVVGTSAAMGWKEDSMTSRTTLDWVHDGTLALWGASAVVAAARRRRLGPLTAVAVAGNLAAGTPAALERVRQRRRDPVALLAPAAVGAGILATLRGGWAPVAATVALGGLRASEIRRGARQAIQ